MKRKNILLTVAILGLAVTLSGCSYIINNLFPEEDDTGSSSADFDVDKVDVDGKTIMQQCYKDYSKYTVYNIDYCPNQGNIKLLIIPVWFSDSSSYIGTSNKEQVRQDIKTAYLGTNSETGWRSVKTYYEELSNNAVTITGTVSNWYSTSYSASEAGRDSEITTSLVTSATDWYFNNNKSDKRSNYDSDNNGYIDAVMLIYGAPDYSSLNNDSLDNLWAYCYWLQEVNETLTPMPNAFFWASYDFMYSSGSFMKPTPAGTNYGAGDTSHCNIDAHTYIHEMGHIFGLEDYYDYSSSKYCPAGAFSMQDYNIGSHDPYSVMALGWANPYVVTGNSEVTIGTFQKTRDLVVISENWNNIGSPFDEYLILELYSPTGLNEHDCSYLYANTVKGPNKIGVRLWHVDARLAYCNSTKVEDGYEVPVFSSDKLTNNVKDTKSTYGVVHAFSNTYDSKDYGSVLGSKYYDYNILQLIINDTLVRHQNKNTIESSDLFVNGSYDLAKYSRQFVNSGPKMNNGSYAAWNIKIDISGSGNDATAKIEIVK